MKSTSNTNDWTRSDESETQQREFCFRNQMLSGQDQSCSVDLVVAMVALVAGHNIFMDSNSNFPVV